MCLNFREFLNSLIIANIKGSIFPQKYSLNISLKNNYIQIHSLVRDGLAHKCISSSARQEISYCEGHKNEEYRILPNTRASPNRRPPRKKFLDHVPEVIRPDLCVNAVYRSVKCCSNNLFVASHEIIQMYMKNSLLQSQVQNHK